MEEERINYKGELIHGPQVLRDEKFGTGKLDEYGNPEIKWSLLGDRADDFGFDKQRCIENDFYKIVEYILPIGTRLQRYGHPGGRFTAPVGTEFEELSLPYEKDTYEYHEYIVIADGVKVLCMVDKGYVSPGFGMPGGGIQYWHHQKIVVSLKKKLLKEDETWKTKFI